MSTVQEANKAMERDPNAIFFHGVDNGHLDLHGYPCVITHATRQYLKNSMAFSFQKNSPYKKLFSYFLLAMRQSGQIERLYIKHETYLNTLKTEHESCQRKKTSFFKKCLPNEPNCVPAIRLETVWTSLLVLLLGVLFGFVVSLFEWLDYHNYIGDFKSFMNNTFSLYHLGRNHIIRLYSIIFVLSLVSSFVIFIYNHIKSNISYGNQNVWENEGLSDEQFT